jgi:hypothetical protein
VLNERHQARHHHAVLLGLVAIMVRGAGVSDFANEGGMSGLPWFRMWVDFLEDPKMIQLAFEDQRHFIALCALKAAGVLDQNCNPRMLDRIVAQRLWLDFATIGDVKKRLLDADLINENWQPLAWDKRQFNSDHDPTRAERQKRYRERKKRERNEA